MSYLYSLPTTGALKFTSLVSDPTNAHVTDIARATSARNKVRAILKETRRTEAHNKDWMACANAVNDYLPHLLAIMRCTECDALLLKGVPVFSWRSTLSTVSAKSGRNSMSSFHYELSFVLLTYAMALCNSATTSVLTLGQYERDLGVSESERKTKDEQINTAADTLCRAAGVLKLLAETVIPEWEASGGDLRGRPPEATREVASALSRICLADAEKLAVRRLLSKSVAIAQAVTVPGPPLPRGHPSPSLLSKLYINVNAHYDSARSLAKSVGPGDGAIRGQLKQTFRRDRTTSGAGEDEETGGTISQDLRTYLADGRVFSAALAHKWLGVDSGENSNKTGEAVAYMTMARNGLLELQKKAKIPLPLMRKGKVERAKRKDRIVEELEDVDAFLRAYKRTNDTVLFQPIPAESSLLTQMPAGRSALALRPFSLPEPAFTSRRGVDSFSPQADLSKSLASMKVEDDVDSDSDASEIDQPLQQSNYF